MQKELIMKKYIPFGTLITLGIYMLYTLVVAVISDDAAFLVFCMALFIVIPLVTEIVGRIINAKAHKVYADVIAVYSVLAVGTVPVVWVIVGDLNSSGFLAGLAAFTFLMTLVPIIALSFIVNTVILIRRRVTARKASAEPLPEPSHEADVPSAESAQDVPAETER